MLKKRILLIVIPIALLFIFYFSMNETKPSEVIGWDDFKNEIKSEFTNIEMISCVNLINPTISFYVRLNKPYEKEEIDTIFLRIIEFLGNEESYNSVQRLHKKKFTYSADEIIINFEYVKGDNSIYSYYKSSSEASGENFPFNSFKYWGLFYQGEYIKTYELPEK